MPDKDQLTECRVCQSKLCYQINTGQMIIWQCFSCGFSTHHNLLLNTDYQKTFEQTLPNLYQVIKKVDKDGFVWYPAVHTIEGKGIVFVDGTNENDWKWCFAPHVPVKFEEREKFKKKDGTYFQFKTDMKKAIHFERHQYSLAITALNS